MEGAVPPAAHAVVLLAVIGCRVAEVAEADGGASGHIDNPTLPLRQGNFMSRIAESRELRASIV